MEKISAYLDGECGEFEAAQALRQLGGDTPAREAWALYHRVGDALRGDRVSGGDFTARVMARIEHEPVVLAPRRATPRVMRYAMAAAASLAGVAVVLGIAFQGTVGTGPELAQKAPSEAPSAREVSTLLAAHQDYAVGSTINPLGAYVRTVAVADPAPGRR
ncbi:MAG: sigma-E factor negative regulatory protein [Novosphingobium sp.]